MRRGADIQLLLFLTDPGYLEDAIAAGIDGVVVDFEHVGKDARQTGADTEINLHGRDDVRIARVAADRRVVVCRVNNTPERLEPDIDAAIDAGADEVLLPMVESFGDVERALGRISGRGALGLMIETEWAVGHARELATYPLRRVFVGLHDLAIQRGSRHIFESLRDGTIDLLRDAFGAVPFGFAGLTRPDCGAPIPCSLLMAELHRLHCDFTFLRRSFLRDVPRPALPAAVASIRTAWARLGDRMPVEIERDHDELYRMLDRLPLPALP